MRAVEACGLNRGRVRAPTRDEPHKGGDKLGAGSIELMVAGALDHWRREYPTVPRVGEYKRRGLFVEHLVWRLK